MTDNNITERARANMQLNRALFSIRVARKIFDTAGAPPTIRGTAATIEELTADLLEYIKAERTESPADEPKPEDSNLYYDTHRTPYTHAQTP